MEAIELINRMVYLQPDMASKCQTELNIIKTVFFDTLKSVCHDFVVDDDNRAIVGDLFNWCIRNTNGHLDPRKGLWLYGNIGTGKSTLMKAIIKFAGDYWLRDSGEHIKPRWSNVPMFCGRYAIDGFSVFDSIPMGLDELGTEIAPTNHVGNKLNVVAHLINTIYDNNSDIPYIVTTNHTLKEILNLYGARTVDRIGQLFNLVEIKGATKRDTSAIWKLIKEEDERSKNPQ